MNAIARTASRRSALAHYAELARIGKVLASPARLRLVDLLRQGPRSVEALAAEAGLTVANASQHLQHLRRARLAVAERRGSRVEYALAGEGVSRMFAALRELAEDLLPEMDRLATDVGVLDPADRESLLERIRRGEVALLDVRPAAEFQAGHLPGAVSVPIDELSARMGELPRDREWVAYCRGPYCTMALEAAALLLASGYRARHLDLGVPDLRARRFRVVAGDAPPPRSPRRPRRATPAAP